MTNENTDLEIKYYRLLQVANKMVKQIESLVQIGHNLADRVEALEKEIKELKTENNISRPIIFE